MSKPTTEELVMLAQQLRETPHSSKGVFIARHAHALHTTPKTLYGWLKQLETQQERKTRSDRGSSGLTLHEAQLIAALLRESRKQTGKQLGTVGMAIDILRSNQLIKAEGVDKTTGEIRPLSTSAVERALRGYGLHPDQLNRPAPAQALRSSHPNALWQIDASLCVLYYLPRNGLAVMDKAVFYHNKPDQTRKVENDRVWRYAVTDHTSGAAYVEYVYGGESGENLASVLINAMQHRGVADPFHGVPAMVMLDPGSANTGALFKNLCYALGVRVQINGVHNPRAKGQVEGFHNIIERDFESRLKFAPVKNLEELNQRSWQWMRVFNATQIHRRHGLSRYAAWSKISSTQLIKAPSPEVCRSLTHEKPDTRVVNGYMQISWKSNLYDVGHIPGLSVGDKVDVARNPWKDNSLRIITTGSDGVQVFYEADLLRKDDFGFIEGAATVGDEYKRHAASATEQAQQVLDKLAMEASSVAELEGKRKAKATPFGGKVDAFKPLVDAEPNLPDWMEKRGQASSIQAPDTRLRPLNLVEAAKQLRGRLGPVWLPECYGELQALYPTGDVPQEDIERLEQHFLKPHQKRPVLRVVGG